MTKQKLSTICEKEKNSRKATAVFSTVLQRIIAVVGMYFKN